MNTDPFGTATLRRAAVQAWRSSPTRFREDANAEEDLVLGGYRDRWFVELAQNAADAAARAGVDGVIRVSVVDGELRVANTGEPLDAAGVAALASLRASAKRNRPGQPGQPSVGRFGVGFAAVLRITSAPRVVSASGGIAFSAARTREAIDAIPALHEDLAHRRGRVPVLRLVWPTGPDEPPVPQGFTTEVRLPLQPDVAAQALLAEAAAQAADLLLALPALRLIEMEGRLYRRDDLDEHVVELREPQASTRWRLVRRHGAVPLHLQTADLGWGAEEHHRPEWSVCWAVPVSETDVPRPVDEDVLHAPTPTDERLSLPARLLATLPVEPSRRRIRHGAAVDHVLAEAVRCYPDLVVAVPPAHRAALVPAPDFPRSEVDALLRDGVVAALRAARWLPAADGRADLAPRDACVLDSPAPNLVALLADVVPGLLAAPLSDPARAAALVALEVPRLGLADVVAAVSGMRRPPAWWRSLYEALSPLAGPGEQDELAALPVPLADGRIVTGPRSTIVLDQLPADTRLGSLAVPGLRVVHPDAVHPLLIRLGAQLSGPTALLDSAALREAVERSVDDAEAGLDVTPLAQTVLRLVTAASAGPGDLEPWLGALALPDADGVPRRADELVLPDGVLRGVLAPGGPLGVLHQSVASSWPPQTLRAIGVLDGFSVLVDEDPVGPDHDLPGERTWWASLPEPPNALLAVRDLDLVDDAAWPRALRLLAADPGTNRVLRAGSYTGWWLARHARLAGRPPRHWRLGSALDLAGLYDPAPDVGLDDALLAAAGVRTTLSVTDGEDAADLLLRLADKDRHPSPATVRAAHAALAAAHASHAFDLDALDPPFTVRAITAAVLPADDAYVLDLPWLAGIAAPDRTVAGGDPLALAEVLDLPLASEMLSAQVVSHGVEVPWSSLPEVAAACEALGRQVPSGTFVLHDQLLVHTSDGSRRAVPCWVADEVVHASDPLRALLWAVGYSSRDA